MPMRKRQSGLTMLEVIIAAVLLSAVMAMTFAIMSSSSDQVAAAQVALELEERAREVLNQITKDLRQSSSSKILAGGGGTTPALTKKADTSTDSPPTPPTAPLAEEFNISVSPNNVWMTYPYTDISIRMPQEANDPAWSPTTFASTPEAYWTRRSRYELVMDMGEEAIGHPNGVDDNANGLVDEQAIKKYEYTLDALGNVTKTVTSVICRDVQRNGFQVRFIASGQNAGKVKISLTLEKRDPKARNKPTIVKTVETFIDLRN